MSWTLALYNGYTDLWHRSGTYRSWNLLKDLSGYTQYKNTQKSVQAQISYNDYIKRGNERAFQQWQKNVGSKGLTIKNPELSYPGAIYRADTGSARAMYDADNSRANFYGNVPYRAAGLYGIVSRVSRWN